MTFELDQWHWGYLSCVFHWSASLAKLTKPLGSLDGETISLCLAIPFQPARLLGAQCEKMASLTIESYKSLTLKTPGCYTFKTRLSVTSFFTSEVQATSDSERVMN